MPDFTLCKLNGNLTGLKKGVDLTIKADYMVSWVLRGTFVPLIWVLQNVSMSEVDKLLAKKVNTPAIKLNTIKLVK